MIAFIIILAILSISIIITLLTSSKHYNEKQNDSKARDLKESLSENYLDKGKIGENYVKSVIGKTIPGKQYVVNNLILSNEEGTKSTEIDHIVINRHGFFVIETKDRGGNICGCDNDEIWVQSYDYSDDVNNFPNPVKQNEIHIKNLQRTLKTNIPMRSVVVFIDADLHNVYSENVINSKDLSSVLNSGIFPLSINELEKYYQQLLYFQSIQISHKQHVNNIHNRHGF